MSVTFSIVGSPTHTVRIELSDGEFEYMEQDLLPSCNFANSNALWVMTMIGQDIDPDGNGYIGKWEVSDLPRVYGEIRDAIANRAMNFGVDTIRDHDRDAQRLFSLHAVVHAAIQFNAPVSWG